MKIAYFDCFCGAAGDMILGALVDAGCPVETLRQVVDRLGLPEVTLTAQRVTRQGIAGTQVQVLVWPAARRKHRHLPQIERIIDEAGLPPAVGERAKAVFRRLAAAEAAVHDTAPEKVHFHEVGAADAIVDVVGAAAALDALGVDAVECSAIPTGHGTLVCEHGVMPVPAPATAILLRGVPLAACEEEGELTTPTGAAVLTTIARRYGPPPAMRIGQVGYGAGTREGRTRPNLLRVLIGEVDGVPAESELISVLETNLDDMDGQALAHAAQKLRDAGALDVVIVPIIMKKGRPGHLLSVLCPPAAAERLEALVFAETTTLGVRRHAATRSTLARRHETVETRYGPVRVKVGARGEQVLQAWPEHDDCAAAAERHGVSLAEVRAAALSAWRRS